MNSFVESGSVSAQDSFAPSELHLLTAFPRLARWAAFFRRYAAGYTNTAADFGHKSYSIIFRLIDANYE
jgi:hypothetical protein